MSGSTAIAEDVTQETFFTLLRDGRSFDPARGPLQAFLAGIARNHVLKALARNRPQESDDLLDDYPAGDDGALCELLRRESLDAVRDAVLRLPPQYREAVVLCDLEEMDYSAAAAVLNVPVGTVRSRLSRGRRLLLNRLTKEENKEARTKSVRCLSMNCEMWAEILMDVARGAPPQPGEDEALRHAAACDACGAILQHQRALSERLHELARQSQTLDVSPHIEATVLAGFRSRHRARRRTEAARWLNIAAALALIASASLFLMRTRIPAPPPATPAAVEDLRGFLPVPYRGAPLERGYIVRVNMPRTALVTLGMPLAAGTPETVQADLLLADDGTAHAVRLVR